MLNRHKDELSLEWDKRWEHLQLGEEMFCFFLLVNVVTE